MPSRKTLSDTFDRLCDDVAVVFPFFFVFYASALVSSVVFEQLNTLFFWPAFHACIVLLGLLTLLSIRRRGVRRLVGIVYAGIRRSSSATHLKTAGIITLAVCALFGGADPVSLLLLVFGGAAVLFRSIDERLPPMLAATMLVSIPLLQLMGAQNAASWMAVYAFEALTIVVFSAAVRVMQEPKEGSYPQIE